MPTTLLDIARDHAVAVKERTAFVFLDSSLREERTLTFGDLDQQSRAIAAGLQACTRMNDRVVVAVSAEYDFVSAFFGCVYAGLIAVPIVPVMLRKEAHTRRLASVLHDAQPRLVLVDEKAAADTAQWLTEHGFADITAMPIAAICSDAAAWRMPRTSEASVLFLQYTSGSTGVPKGVVVTHKNILCNEALIKKCFGHDQRTIFVGWLPLFHDMGLIGNVLQPFYLGVKSVLFSPMTFLTRPSSWLRAISTYRATTSGGPNFAYQLCADRVKESEIPTLDLTSWRTAYVGAEPVRAHTLESFTLKFAPSGFQRRAFLPCYGLAEATLFVTGVRHEEEPRIQTFDAFRLQHGQAEALSSANGAGSQPVRRLVSVGDLRSGQPIVVVNPQSFEQCAPGMTGEIWISGDSVTEGYWRKPQETRDAFDARIRNDDGAHLRTGDLGFVHDGHVYVTGRIKDLVILRGRNYAPHDIEYSAQRSDDTLPADACAAFSVERDGAEQLIVVQELRRSSLRSADAANALRSIWRAILRDHGIRPFEVVAIRPGSLPRTTSGKVQRHRAKVLYERAELDAVERFQLRTDAGRRRGSVGYVAPGCTTEGSLARIWADVLGLPLEGISVNDNFFDLGGDSIALVQVQGQIQAELGKAVSTTDLLSHHTIRTLSDHLEGLRVTPSHADEGELAPPFSAEDRAIAVIGMAGRFPRARNPEELWTNLQNGHESVQQFSDEQMLKAGAPADLLAREDYVKAGVILGDIDQFDAAYFGMTPREAEIMDPQQRILLECAVEALESAGYPEEASGTGRIGVFVARGESIYSHRFTPLFDQRRSLGSMIAALIGTSRGYSSTLISHHLGLTGPSTSVDTACSSSLVAVHQACRSLIAGECELAIAGGASIDVLQGAGYLYEEGNIASPDGRCRAFSADAQGTVRGGGAGIVVLRRLKAAQSAGDTIHAVIRGSAVNNDGGRKGSFAAPSVAGQAEVIRSALAFAQVDAATIQYVETHGTSTALGDPIEVEALTLAYASATPRLAPCAIGSLKTNIGHLDAAAGIAGLIKVVLSLKHRKIPASLNFKSPNPHIDFTSGLFYVNTQLREWPSPGAPRRAAVSAFGVGGTNAHAILEEWIEATAAPQDEPSEYLVPLSARSPDALACSAASLASYLEQPDAAALPSVAFTLQAGRKAFPYRIALVSADRSHLIRELREQAAAVCPSEAGARAAAFLFPGQGTQRVGMASALYARNRLFRAALDECASILEPLLGKDIKSLVHPGREDDVATASNLLTRTEYAQPTLFAIEWSLATLWQKLGVHPSAMVGHSLGEYVAACIAGVFTLPEALRVIVVRGRLMQATAPGAMLAVPAGEDETLRFIQNSACEIAATNGPMQTIVSGAQADIHELSRALARMGVSARLVHESHAFHSRLMDPILSEFEACVAQGTLRPPAIPFISNVTGDWIDAAEATNPSYWRRHLRSTVRFGDCLRTLNRRGCDNLIELGPGEVLTGLARRSGLFGADGPVPTMPAAGTDHATLLTAIAAMWKRGAAINWTVLSDDTGRRRVPLPTYPFERQRYWIEERPQTSGTHSPAGTNEKAPDVSDWFYVPSWKRAPPMTRAASADQKATWLVFTDLIGIGAQVATLLSAHNVARVICVRSGDRFVCEGTDDFVIDAAHEEDYDALIAAINLESAPVLRVIHSWSVGPSSIGDLSPERFYSTQTLGFTSLCYLTRALSRARRTLPTYLLLVTSGVHAITGHESLAPERATMLALAKVIPQEERSFECAALDLSGDFSDASGAMLTAAAKAVLDEATAPAPGSVIAVRGANRWVQIYEPMRLEKPTRSHVHERHGDQVWLVTGGLGNIGLQFARVLATQWHAKLVLVSRSGLPDRASWSDRIATHDISDKTSRQLHGLLELEKLGADFIVVRGDVADRSDMERAFRAAREKYGSVDGIVHAAADMSNIFVSVQDLSALQYVKQCAAKVVGMLTLHHLAQKEGVKRCMVTSSLSSVLGGLGFAAYAAANSVADALAEALSATSHTKWTSVNWDVWAFGENDSFVQQDGVTSSRPRASLDGMTPAQGASAFARILAHEVGVRVAVAISDLDARIRKWVELRRATQADAPTLEKSLSGGAAQTRARRTQSYVQPVGEAETTIAGIIKDLIGVEPGAQDNFFQLGGDSLMATQVVSRIRMVFGINLSIREFVEAPTVRALADKIAARERISAVMKRPDSEVGAAGRRVEEV